MMEDLLFVKQKLQDSIHYNNVNLSSGGESDYYIDLKSTMTDPKLLLLFSQYIPEIYTDDIDAIVGIALGGIPISVVISLLINKPYITIRKEQQDHGLKNRIIGETINQKVLIIDAVATKGNSILESAQILRNAHAIVNKAIVIIDRQEEQQKLLKEHNLELISLITVNDMMTGKYAE